MPVGEARGGPRHRGPRGAGRAAVTAMLQPMLCGWFGYMALLGLLMGASAGWGSRLGKLAGLVTLVSAWRALAMVRPVGPNLYLERWPSINLATFLLEGLVLAIALWALARAPRQDTRLIALLLAGSALLPLALYFWQIPQ